MTVGVAPGKWPCWAGCSSRTCIVYAGSALSLQGGRGLEHSPACMSAPGGGFTAQALPRRPCSSAASNRHAEDSTIPVRLCRRAIIRTGVLQTSAHAIRLDGRAVALRPAFILPRCCTSFRPKKRLSCVYRNAGSPGSLRRPGTLNTLRLCMSARREGSYTRQAPVCCDAIRLHTDL